MARRVKSDKRVFFSGFGNLNVDYIRTVVPAKLARDRSLTTLIQVFMEKRPTTNARHLAQKAVVGLLPKSIFARRIWKAAR